MGGDLKPPGRGMSFAGSGLKAGCRRGQGGRKQHHCVLGFAEVQWDWGGPGVPGGEIGAACYVCVYVCAYVQAGSLMVVLNGGVSLWGHHQ